MPPTADIDAAFEAWLTATRSCERPDAAGTKLRYRSFGHAVAALEAESDYLVLCRIETPGEHRGRGQASAVLSLLKSICDRHNVTLLGQATAYDDTGLDQNALLQWYHRHGFQIDLGRTAQPLVWYPRKP